jgi:hypothetical protein
MLHDQSRRGGFRRGVVSCAALALAAGTAMAQQSTDQQKAEHKDQKHTMEHKEHSTQQSSEFKTEKQDQQGWKTVTTLPSSQSDVILAGKSKDDKDVHLVFDNGRLVEAKCDDKDIQKDKIQIKGEQLRVMGDDNKELVTFKLPSRILASGPDMGFEQDRWTNVNQDRSSNRDQERFESSRFSQDRYAGGPFPREGEMRSNQTWSTQQDRWSDQPQRDQWNTRDSWNTRSTARDSRDVDARSDWNRQDSWNTGDDRFRMEHRTERFDQPQRFESTQTYRDSRMDTYGSGDPYFRSSDRMESQRMYGTTQERPIVLGIIMDEADANELRRTDYNSGLRIQRIREGTAAQRAGLREGDVVVLIDNQPADTRVLERRLTTVRSGDDVRFRVLRDGRERDVVVRAEPLSEDASIHPKDTNLPNVDQPGPFNVYRPTRPEEWDDHRATGRRIYSDFDRNDGRDVYIYERDRDTRDRNWQNRDSDWRDSDRVYYREGDANWRDRSTRSTVGDRDQLNRTYYSGETDVYIDRNTGGRTYYTTPDTDTRFETRTYYTDRDTDNRNFRYQGDNWPVMPNEQTPGPVNNYRPTRPSTSERDVYRPSVDRR